MAVSTRPRRSATLNNKQAVSNASPDDPKLTAKPANSQPMKAGKEGDDGDSDSDFTELYSDVEQEDDPEDLRNGKSEQAHGSEATVTKSKPHSLPRKKTVKFAKSSDESAEEFVPKRATEKARPASSKNASKSSKKASVVNSTFSVLPLDIISEIMRYLSPGDLLHLMALSKRLCILLRSPSGKSIWSQARTLRSGLSMKYQLPPLIMETQDTTGDEDLTEMTIKYAGESLPTIETRDMTEWQIATLLFDATCQDCGTAKGVTPNMMLRVRFCAKQCLNKNIVTTEELAEQEEAIHPRTIDCCAHFYNRKMFFLKSDIEYFSKKLFELKKADDAIKKLKASRGKEKSPPEILVKKAKKKRKVSATPVIIQCKMEGGDKEEEEDGPRVVKFCNKRQAHLELRDEDASSLDEVPRDLSSWRKQLDKALTATDTLVKFHRRRAIEAKLVTLGWSRDRFCGAWYRSPVINKQEPLTGPIWDKIRPSVLRLLASIQLTQKKNELKERVETRRMVLQPAYTILRNSLATDEERTTFPLFNDFCLLPSVKPLWEPEMETEEPLVDGVEPAVGQQQDLEVIPDSEADADASSSHGAEDPEAEATIYAPKMPEAQWDNKILDILEEVEEHRNRLRLMAVKCVVAATNDMEQIQDLDGDDGDYLEEAYPDSFFDYPTSFLLCTFASCRTTRNFDGKRFFGSYYDLLKHHHASHSDSPATSSSTHFELPTTIAGIVAGVRILGSVEDDAASTECDALGDIFSWANSSRPKALYGWRVLVDEVYKKLRNTPKKKKMDPPVISIIVEQDDSESEEGSIGGDLSAEEEQEEQEEAESQGEQEGDDEE